MAESTRRQLLNATTDVLKTISSVKRVTREWLPIDTGFNEFPVLIVTEAPTNAPRVRGVIDEFEDKYRIRVWGYVLGSDLYPRADAIEDLYEETFGALMAKATLDGLATDIEAVGDRVTDGGLLERRGFFMQEFVITTYVTHPGP